MASLVFKIVLLICLVESALSNERHMICKDVGDVFAGPHALQNSTTRGALQGHPGKKGIKGDSGEVGPPGPQGRPGNPNYQRVSNMIQTEVRQALLEVIPDLKMVKNYIERIRRGHCQVEHEGKCYWVVFSKINFHQGKAECERFGGNASNIYSQEHYEKILAYIRSVMPPSPAYIEPWLGMTIDPATKQVYLRDGSLAPFVKWLTGYPTTHAGRTQINLQVRINPASTQHMWNYDPKTVRDGALCEFV